MVLKALLYHSVNVFKRKCIQLWCTIWWHSNSHQTAIERLTDEEETDEQPENKRKTETEF